MRLRKRNDESGAAVVESAVVVLFLMVLALGAYEYGTAFQEWLGLSAASREGARVGSSVGPLDNGVDDNADCRVLEAVGSALNATTGDEVLRVTVANFDTTNGTEGSKNIYRPRQAGDPAAQLVCQSGWFRIGYGWPPATRDNMVVDRDWISVRVEYRHNWRTNFLWWSGSTDWQSRSVMQIEPGQGF